MKPIKQYLKEYRHLLVAIICLIPLLIFFAPGHTEKTILILGDSLSTPYGIGAKDSWVYLLQERLDKEKYNYTVVNSSEAGDTTEDGLERLPRNLIDVKPTLTIIELGANDVIDEIPLETTKNNLLTLIRLAKEAKSKVLLLGMNSPSVHPSENAAAFHQMYVDLAKQENVTLVQFFLKNVENNPHLMQEDKLHPIKEAQTTLLENVWPDIKKLLGRPRR